jgi:hypothetical protein
MSIAKNILVAGVVALLLSCKKDEKSKTRTELLTSGSWHVTAYEVDPAFDWDGDGDLETNVYEIMDQCIKDDHTTFNADGTGTLDEGATKCDPGAPQTVPITWSFQQNETELNVVGSTYLVETLTENQLVVNQIEVVSAQTFMHHVTFSH